MAGIYIEEFLFRGRDAEFESGSATYHVVLGQWTAGMDGSPRLEKIGPMTATRAAELGHPLDTILGDAMNNLLLDLDAANAKAAAAEQALEQAQPAQPLQEESGPSNPVLNTITFGLFGN